MAVIQNLVAMFRADSRDFESGTKRARKSLYGLQKQSAQTQRAMLNIVKGIIGIGSVTAGLYAVKRGLQSVITSASDAEEISSKFDVVFKNLSTQAHSWAENFGDSVGRSTQDVEEWMAGLQDTFVPLGIARNEAYDLSKALTTLAVDVASFNNKADADVIRDFTSALVGNHETVRKYGIIISESAIKQAALNKGWAKSYKELTDLQKVMLRFQLIQEGTADAQGDAIRTGDSYANQIKRLRANFSELSVTIGNELVPALADAAKGLNDVFSRINEMKANWADFYADFWGRQKIFDRINESWVSMDWSVKIKPNVEGAETFAEAEKIYRDIANRLRNKDRESIYVGTIFAPKQEETTGRSAFEQEIDALEGKYTQLTEKEIEAMVKAEEENQKFAARRTEITARMYEDMGVKDHRYRDAQIALLDIQRQDYEEFINDKTLLDEWYFARKRQLDQNAIDKWVDTYSNMGNVWDGLVEDSACGLDSLASAMTEFEKTGEMNWRGWLDSLYTSYLDTINKMIIANIAKGVINPLLGSIGSGIGNFFTGGGGGGQIGADINPAMANVAHGGGVMGKDSFPTKAVPSAVFANAPRLHTGTQEYYAKLRKNEGVFTEEQMKNLGPAGNGGVTNNYFDIKTPNADSFRKSRTQIANDLKRVAR